MGWGEVATSIDAGITAFLVPLYRVWVQAGGVGGKEVGQQDRANPLYTVESVKFDAIKSPVPEMVDADRTNGSRLLTGPTGRVEILVNAARNFNHNTVFKVVDENGEPLVVYRYAKSEEGISGGVRFAPHWLRVHSGPSRPHSG